LIDQHQHAPASSAPAHDTASGAPVRQIIASVAAAFGLTPADLVGKGRRAEVVQARYTAIHAVRQAKPHFSLSQIGGAFGDRDHSTIFHALQKMQQQGVPQPDGSTRAFAALTGAPSRKGGAA
jgi:chromosomal replication initiation ATPase DnaA